MTEGARQAGGRPPNGREVVASPLPPELRPILGLGEPAARDAAWDEFVARYSRLFLAAAASCFRITSAMGRQPVPIA